MSLRPFHEFMRVLASCEGGEALYWTVLQRAPWELQSIAAEAAQRGLITFDPSTDLATLTDAGRAYLEGKS